MKDLDDQRHPAELHAEDAAESIRALNHASFAVDSIDQPSTIYRVLGDLYTLVSRLDQAIGQLARPLQRQLDTGRLQVDEGTPFAGDPALAVATAVEQLQEAQLAANTAYGALTAAQVSISGLYAR